MLCSFSIFPPFPIFWQKHIPLHIPLLPKGGAFLTGYSPLSSYAPSNMSEAYPSAQCTRGMIACAAAHSAHVACLHVPLYTVHSA